MPDIIQLLRDTRTETPVEDVDEWVARLTSIDEPTEPSHLEPSLLTEREAEVAVRLYGAGQTRQEISESMDLSANRVDRLRYAATEDLLAADRTLDVLGELRREVRPKP